jgi:hypothetical protein
MSAELLDSFARRLRCTWSRSDAAETAIETRRAELNLRA